MSIALGGALQGLGRGIGLAQARKERDAAAARAEEDMALRRDELAARRQYGVIGTPFFPGDGGGSGGRGGYAGYSGGASEVDPAALRAYALEKYDLPEYAVDGILMNIGDESGFNPGINEAEPTVAGSRGGFGLFQHTGTRRVALERYAASRNRPASDPYLQFDFAMEEMNGDERGAREALLASKDAGAAAAAFATNFLRPRADHLARRVSRYTSGQGWRPEPAKKAEPAPIAAPAPTETAKTEPPLTWAAMRRIMTS